MTMKFRTVKQLAGVLLAAGALSACNADLGIESFNLNKNDPALRTAPRPKPDSRGVISYPNYQMVAARQGDTVATLAARIGLGAAALAGHNGLKVDQRLRAGELLALPGGSAIGPAVGEKKVGRLDIKLIASSAIKKADQPVNEEPIKPQGGIEPIQHQVERGETAYSIARLYNVSVTALASWNRLGPDLAVREGQQLLIPIVEGPQAKVIVDNSKPGLGTVVPPPPSASKPLPRTVKPTVLPASPNLKQFKTTQAPRKFLVPVQGEIIKQYSGKKGGNEGINIAASAGTAVKAAEDGEVALVSKSVGSNTIVLLRHADNIFTVYSNVTNVNLTKGQKVKRGQRLGAVAAGSPPFLHFEVRRGTISVDPTPFL